MNVSRILGSLLSVGALALLAACGGGGGGGGVTPPTGGGGGGTPPTATPSPVSTATPTPAPTATPTPTGGGSLSVSSSVYTAYDGAGHNAGADDWQMTGVTAPGEPGDGDVVNNVGSGQSTDNLSACALSSESQMTSNNYHVHAFVGIYVNGVEYAVPDAIGMAAPSGEPITAFSCAYSIHTHSASGVIHVEDPSITGTFANTQPPAQYNLQTLMDIWGQNLSGLAGGSGMPAIYVGTPSTRTSTGEDLVTSYSLVTDAPGSVLLAHHAAIWLIYGTPPATGVPQIAFGISN